MIVWDKLSTDRMHASRFDMFKNRIGKYLIGTGYTYSTIVGHGDCL